MSVFQKLRGSMIGMPAVAEREKVLVAGNKGICLSSKGTSWSSCSTGSLVNSLCSLITSSNNSAHRLRVVNALIGTFVSRKTLAKRLGTHPRQ